MEEKEYSEISALKEIILKHRVKIKISQEVFLAERDYYPAVQFSLANKTFQLFANDEYNDFSVGNPALSLCIVLRELEDYNYAKDYLVWCTHHGFNPEINQVRTYYMGLAKTYREMEEVLGRIESKISSYDFELNAGAAQKLRRI